MTKISLLCAKQRPYIPSVDLLLSQHIRGRRRTHRFCNEGCSSCNERVPNEAEPRDSATTQRYQITCTSRQQPHNENWATRSLAERSAVSPHRHLGTIHTETYRWNNSAAQVFLNRQCKETSHYERKRFDLDYNSDLCPMAELCRQHGIVGNAGYPYSAPRQQEWA